MDLLIFDLDGTLLNSKSKVSPYTSETLKLLAERDIAYTVATGRTLHGTRALLEGHAFDLPQIYKNGVLIWNPTEQDYSHCQGLSLSEISHILEAIFEEAISPFVFTLEADGKHGIYHPPLQNEDERQLAAEFKRYMGIAPAPLAAIPATAIITNISALALPEPIDHIVAAIDKEEHLVAYAGTAIEGRGLKWLDIHHTQGSKGAAVDVLKKQLGARRVICFGDNDNDLSMFEAADECYAPANARQEVLEVADAIIGHHDEEGVARFLRQRFELPGA